MWNMLNFGYALIETAEMLGTFFMTPIADLPYMPSVLLTVLQPFLPSYLTVGSLLIGSGFIIFLQLKIAQFVANIVKSLV